MMVIKELEPGELEKAPLKKLLAGIPEFDRPYVTADYLDRLSDRRHLILVAYDNKKPVGFKIAYDRDGDGSFYSWMGGILKSHRRQKIAEKLAKYQQKWAMSNGFNRIRMKTLNRHTGMLIFALKDGFRITGFKADTSLADSKIYLEKHL
jgi:predicted GNAT superfamily acetyltransferase